MNINIILLVLVTLIWGTTFPLLRIANAHLNGLEICLLRFLTASLCLLPFALRSTRRTWAAGALLGCVVLSSYASQAYGLGMISSNRSAFLTSLNILMIPFIALLFGTRLGLKTVVSAALACAGIGLMSWDGGADLAGDTLTLFSAFSYALYVVLLSRYAKDHPPLELASTQILTMTLVCFVALAGGAAQHGDLAGLPARAAPVWKILVFLGVAASAGSLLLQAYAQRKLSASRAGLIYALEPVFAAGFGWWWLGETMSARAIVGGVVVVLSAILNETEFGSARLPDQNPT